MFLDVSLSEALAPYVAFYSETFKMADAMQSSCAAPVFKRPRLEFSPCDGESLISFESASSEERFSIDSGLQEDAYEASSSNECPAEETAPREDPLDQQTLVFEQCTESGFVPESAAGMLSHESFGDPPEQEENDSNISPISWVHRQMSCGMDPRLILGDLLPKGAFIPQNVNDGLLWRFILNLLSEPKRTKLAHINTLDDVVHLLRTCRNIIVLTGAGVSVSCGIPDFRSRDGIYARLSKDYPDLPDPQAMFDINYFRRDPRPFFKFAKEIYPGQFSPSPSHKFIQLLEKQGKLLRNYSQNIDTLEHAAGIKNVITCHGSFATATCTICRHKVDSSVIKEDIFNQRIPHCPVCPPESPERGIMKPDIVFFGEGLSDEFHEAMAKDKEECDLLIVMGSSLKVRPVAMIPSSIPTNVPQILINREPLKHLTFDVELLGDCDVIIGELCKRLSPEWCTEDIPQRSLREVVARDPSEINNNAEPSEESNSCDCRGLSAICLEDDASGAAEDAVVLSADGESAADGSYLFFPPGRYVFEGAEVFKEDEETEDDDDRSSSPTDDSSEPGSPRRPFEAPSEAEDSRRVGAVTTAETPTQPPLSPSREKLE